MLPGEAFPTEGTIQVPRWKFSTGLPMRDLLTCILESHTEPSSSALAPVPVLQLWVLGDLWGFS